ncbi:hypothetical protein [Kitasatospora sp. NPDC002965]|uniref:hypothetical protein n=1 Tax=Kitasatospora sp. NPDC002965 TaxID=3154775 RepID=UPI0033ACC974
MTREHSNEKTVLPTAADLSARMADTRERLTDVVDVVVAKADVGARARDAAAHARESIGHTADQALHAVVEQIGEVADSLRAGGVQVKEHTVGLTDSAGEVFERLSETSTRGRALKDFRYSGPVLVAVGGALLATAVIVTVRRRRR